MQNIDKKEYLKISSGHLPLGCQKIIWFLYWNEIYSVNISKHPHWRKEMIFLLIMETDIEKQYHRIYFVKEIPSHFINVKWEDIFFVRQKWKKKPKRK